ncbi:hypothetical protein FRC12_017698, partial [Ceratobasidium sp. 428]
MRVFLGVSAALAAAAPAIAVTAHQPIDKRSVTVYNPTATPTVSINTAAAQYTGAAAYDTTMLNPPAPPGDLNKNVNVQLYAG